MKELIGTSEGTLSDGSWDFGNGVIGPSLADVEFFNALPDSVSIPETQEKKPHNNRFARPVLFLVDLVPKPLQKPAQVALLTTAAGLSAGAVCGTDDKSKIEPTSTSVVTVVKQETERFNPSAFLRMPMPRDPDAKVVQGWTYTTLINGTLNHHATDYIIGTNLAEAKTWKPFPIMAAADGVACKSEYTATADHPAGNQIQVSHSNGYTSFYIHNNPESLAERLHPLPDCNITPKTKWLSVRQGDKLSEASDYGAVKSYTHLHFELKDPKGKVVDPYDLYKTRTGYPSPNFDDGVFCGDNTLWINCPIDSNKKAELVPTIAPRPTLAPVPTVEVPVIPTVAPRVETRAQEIERKWNEAVGLGQRFVTLMLDGSSQAISEAQAMEISSGEKRIYPDTEYDIAPIGDLSLCSQDMRAGQFQNWSAQKLSNFTRVNRGDSAADRLNKQQGLSPNDRYAVGFHFTFNQYNLSARARVGFRDYGDYEMYQGNYMVFEDTGDGLKLAKNEFCFGIPSPIGNQYDWSFK